MEVETTYALRAERRSCGLSALHATCVYALHADGITAPFRHAYRPCHGLRDVPVPFNMECEYE